MIKLDPTKFKTPAFRHQLEGTNLLLRHSAFALFDEMGVGKSKQVVDAACALSEAGEIEFVVVVAPASVRSVWLDPESGEIKKHAWVKSGVWEFHSPRKGTRWREVWKDENPRMLIWIVTNFEFLRQRENLAQLSKALAKRKALLVVDESSFVKNRVARQTKAVAELRKSCLRCVLLNGTPVANNPLDLYSQMNILDPQILGARFKNFYHFRYRFAVLGGWHMKQVLSYQNLDELQRLVAPHAVRRLKKDCLDLPPKLFTTREVKLDVKTWERYQQLRKECLVALSDSETQLEPNAAVKLVRLAQLTSGIVGTVWVPKDGSTFDFDDELVPTNGANVRDLSSEKLDWAVDYLLEETEAHAVIIWTRFRRERERLAERLREHLSSPWSVVELYGGQRRGERELAVAALSSESTLARRVVMLAQPHAGGFGLNLTRATEVVYLSNDFSLTARLQSEDRCHRPGQTCAVTYIDVLATGPAGQRTIDHQIAKALAKKQDLATWTAAAWRRAIEEE